MQLESQDQLVQQVSQDQLALLESPDQQVQQVLLGLQVQQE